MRLTDEEARAIASFFSGRDPTAEIYLYGSRVNDQLRGGDIDLLVISETLGFEDKIDALTNIKEALGDQRIDLRIVTRAQAESDPFVVDVLLQAIRLQA